MNGRCTGMRIIGDAPPEPIDLNVALPAWPRWMVQRLTELVPGVKYRPDNDVIAAPSPEPQPD